MIFEFKNIGTIEEANIELKGLTILTGENDTGKSFLSKSIYSITKTYNEADQFYFASKYEALAGNVNLLFSTLRTFVPLTAEKQQKLNPRIVTQGLANFFYSKTGTAEVVKNSFNSYAKLILDELQSPTLNFLSAANKVQLDNSIKNIKDVILPLFNATIDESVDFNTKCKKYFDKKIVQGVFQLQLNSVQNNEKLEITVKEGDTKLISINVNGNITENFSVESPFFLTDCTIIETPTIIQLDTFITNAFAFPNPFQERADVPLHYQDLVSKIKVQRNSKTFETLNNQIKNIISGEFKIDETGGIIYLKDGDKPIKSVNIASGIKSFGLLQLLLNSNYINESSLLIIDEPEVHLHPKWEVKYAELIIALCKSGITVLISSHSPYLLRALRKYSIQDESIKSKTKLYHGSKSDKGRTIFNDVTEDPEPIFKALAEAMIATA